MRPGSPQQGSFDDGPRRRRSKWRWLKILLLTVFSVFAGFVLLIVLLAVLLAAHIIRAPATSISTGIPSAAPCAPAPCAVLGGIKLTVSDINRNWPVPKDALVKPDPGYHLVRLQVTFTDESGEHEVSPYGLNLRDPLGYQHSASPFLGTGCETARGAALAPGGKVGPTPLCFEAGGPVDGPLKLIWIPSGLTGAQPGATIALP
jgi:hypothetical protein